MAERREFNDITLISLFAGLTVALYFLSEYNIPGVNVIMRVLCPVPFIYLAFRTNLNNVLKGIGLVFIFLFAVNIKDGVFYLLKFGPLTYVSAYVFLRKIKASKAAACIIITGVISSLAAFLWAAHFFGINYFVYFAEQISASFNESYKIIVERGGDKAALETLLLMKKIMIHIIPGIIIFFEAVFTFLFLYSASFTLRKAGVKISFKMPPFRLWDFGGVYLPPLIFGMLLTYLFWSYKIWMTIGVNIIFVFGAVYIIQGLSVTAFFLKKWRQPLFVKLLFFFLMLSMLSVSALFLMILGIADIKFNLRAEKENKK